MTQNPEHPCGAPIESWYIRIGPHEWAQVHNLEPDNDGNIQLELAPTITTSRTKKRIFDPPR